MEASGKTQTYYLWSRVITPNPTTFFETTFTHKQFGFYTRKETRYIPYFYLILIFLIFYDQPFLQRGKFQANMVNLIQMNTPRVVMQETKKAFRNIFKRGNLESAAQALCNLKGVGPTMASGTRLGDYFDW